jgi:hypothetical protein
MGLFPKKHDPISERARALNAQILALESQIKKLSTEAAQPQPRFRSTTGPRGSTWAVPPKREVREPAPQEHFEPVDHAPLQSAEPQPGREHFNDLGVRKYDLVAGWQRFKNAFKPPPASNPKLVNYLAAGSIQGLRPLRYERRVARNRFIFLAGALLLVLWGIIWMIFKHR